MILDNADDADIFYGNGASQGSRDGTGADTASIHESEPFVKFLPQSANGSILITTRDQGLAVRLTGHLRNTIHVGIMTEDEGLMLLEKKLGPVEKDYAGYRIREMWSCIPLAITQGAAYIQSMGSCSQRAFTVYTMEYTQRRDRQMWLLGHDAGDIRRDSTASNSILATLETSFDHIRRVRPYAADLLGLLTFFPFRDTPKRLLKPFPKVRKELQEEEAFQSREIPMCHVAEQNRGGIFAAATREFQRSRMHKNASHDIEIRSGEPDRSDEDFEDDFTTLKNYHFVTTTDTKDGTMIEMDRLLHLAARRWLEAQGRLEVYKCRYINRLALVFPKEEAWNWPPSRILYDVARPAKYHRPAERPFLETWAFLMEKLGTYEKNYRAVYTSAEEMFIRSYGTFNECLGPKHESTLRQRQMLAEAYYALEDEDEAHRIGKEVVEMRKKKLGADHPDTLSSGAWLASISGNFKKAKKLQEQLIRQNKKNYGERHPITLISAYTMLKILLDEGQTWVVAEVPDSEIDMYEAVLGEEHGTTLQLKKTLALARKAQGRDAEAVKLMKSVAGDQDPTRLYHRVRYEAERLLKEWTSELDEGASDNEGVDGIFTEDGSTIELKGALASDVQKHLVLNVEEKSVHKIEVTPTPGPDDKSLFTLESLSLSV